MELLIYKYFHSLTWDVVLVLAKIVVLFLNCLRGVTH